MMSEVSDLYQETILDHYKSPRNQRRLEDVDRLAEGQNPLCGDHITVFVKVSEGIVRDITFEGSGCAISTASASLMTEAIKGKTFEEIEELTEKFKLMMSIEEGESPVDPARPGSVLGDLEALQGVRKFPVRIKCADLPWTTLADALNEAG